ncbi:MAG: PH domain-containing protein [Bacilli bacterium]|nr:PH domain-containing protein [Bacilli bacterium]
MENIKLNKKIRTLWLVRNLIIFLFPLVSGIVLLFTIDSVYFVPTLIVVSILLVIILGLLMIFPILRYNRYWYAFNDRKIIITRGVIFKESIVIPVCQIQDLHYAQGPLMQLFKVASVEISTAGSNYTIVGLTEADAKEMITYLEEYLEKRIEELKNEALL